MINLKNISLVIIDGKGDDLNAVKALKHSSKNINFGSVKYITAGEFKPKFCEIHKIPKMSYEGYSAFCLTKLINYVDTDYVLILNSDGFVVNPHLWTDEFLNYDYLGAPWNRSVLYNNIKDKNILADPLIESNFNYHIGNGGFSLRSKKLLKEVNDLYSEKYKGYAEDVIICIAMRKELENRKMVFPKNYKIAAKFSCEIRYVDNEILSSDNSFGFHCDETHPDKMRYLESVEFE
jgi:hypothetical protein